MEGGLFVIVPSPELSFVTTSCPARNAAPENHVR
jgi:hypothetical protein